MFIIYPQKHFGLISDIIQSHHFHYRCCCCCSSSCCCSSCCMMQDLSRLGRELSQIVIIDNSPMSYMFHPQNAVSWLVTFHTHLHTFHTHLHIDKECCKLIGHILHTFTNFTYWHGMPWVDWSCFTLIYILTQNAVRWLVAAYTLSVNCCVESV